MRSRRNSVHAAKLALLLSLSLSIPSMPSAQPVLPDAGAVGGAIELPEFNLAAETSLLERQLGIHRERLVRAQEQLRGGANTTLSVLVDQLEFRISLLEIVLEPTPTPADAPDARRAQLIMLQENREELQALAERGKGQGIGAQNQAVLEARMAELDAMIVELEDSAGPAPPPPTDVTAPAPPQELPRPAATAPAPIVPGPGPVVPLGPTEARTPPRMTMGDLMSTLSNLQGRIEEVQRLPQPLDPARVFVIPVTTLFSGNGIGPARRALDRGYFADLQTFVANDPVLTAAVAAAGHAVDQSIGILTNPAGDVVVFVDG